MGGMGQQINGKNMEKELVAVKINAADVDIIAHELEDEKHLRKALYFANIFGALIVTERGVIPALLTKEAILQFLLELAVI
ncbi:fructokinase [Vigna unguiculata]|uniref:Fructokinase n=1 Tax=Vigna unguiculata TaxID=3917 RepID=A0A4D6NBA8_VIGUN|nr:fructokinase [Vigna unguiculata]